MKIVTDLQRERRRPSRRWKREERGWRRQRQPCQKNVSPRQDGFELGVSDGVAGGNRCRGAVFGREREAEHPREQGVVFAVFASVRCGGGACFYDVFVSLCACV